nr:MAG TPA: hypothetical protein [Caudoviricetes sp.]
MTFNFIYYFYNFFFIVHVTPPNVLQTFCYIIC